MQFRELSYSDEQLTKWVGRQLFALGGGSNCIVSHMKAPARFDRGFSRFPRRYVTSVTLSVPLCKWKFCCPFLLYQNLSNTHYSSRARRYLVTQVLTKSTDIKNGCLHLLAQSARGRWSISMSEHVRLSIQVIKTCVKSGSLNRLALRLLLSYT